MGEFNHAFDSYATTYGSNFSLTNFTHLEKTIKEISKKSNLPYETQLHDIHHYTVIYILIMAFIIAIVIFKVKYNKIKSHVSERVTKPVPMPRISESADTENQNNVI